MAQLAHLKAEMVLDSRGERTISVTAVLGDGTEASVSVPRGKSTGSREAAQVPADVALRTIEDVILPHLRGTSVDDPSAFDEALLALDGTSQKSRLGGNTTLAVSTAVLRAAALSRGVSLVRHIREHYGLPDAPAHPRLLVNVINGGLHANNGLAFQEYLIIPKTESSREAVVIARAFHTRLGEVLVERFGEAALRPGDEGGYAPDLARDLEPFEIIAQVAGEPAFEGRVDLGLDAAGNTVRHRSDELMHLYDEFYRTYHPWYLEDPFGEEDFEHFKTVRERAGAGNFVVGDDLTVTNAERIQEAHRQGAINGVIIKPNQAGTIRETIAAVKKAHEYGWGVFVSHRSGETMDDFIADLAYAVCATGIKVGAPTQTERVSKYDRLCVLEAAQSA